MQVNEAGWWEQLERDANQDGRLAAHIRTVTNAVMTVSQASASIAYVLRQATALARAELTITGQMYPSCVNDVRQLLAAHNIGLPKSAVRVPALGDSDVEFCALCREGVLSQRGPDGASADDAEQSTHFVRMQPRCTAHNRCIAASRQGERCSCDGKFFHFACMLRHLLAEFDGSTNDDVGRAHARCPLCRGTFCFTDLVELRVDRSLVPKRKQRSSPAAKEPTPTPKKRKLHPYNSRSRSSQTPVDNDAEE
jgi:hypothetical protein